MQPVFKTLRDLHLWCKLTRARAEVQALPGRQSWGPTRRPTMRPLSCIDHKPVAGVSIHPTVWVQSPSAHVLAPRGFLCILNKLAGHRYVGAVAPPFGGAAWEPCFSCGPQTGGARIIRSSSGRQLGPPEAGAAFQLWLKVIRRHIEFGKQCSKKGSL